MPFLGDAAALDAHDHHPLHVDGQARRRHAEVAAAMGPRQAVAQGDAVALDDRVVHLDPRVGERVPHRGVEAAEPVHAVRSLRVAVQDDVG